MSTPSEVNDGLGDRQIDYRFERLAFAWDAQFDHMLTELLRMGIDGVYSDWVDRMVDAARAEALA